LRADSSKKNFEAVAPFPSKLEKIISFKERLTKTKIQEFSSAS